MAPKNTRNVVPATENGESFMAATPEIVAKVAKTGRPVKVLSESIMANVRAGIAGSGDINGIMGGNTYTATEAEVKAANEKRAERANGVSDPYTIDTLSAKLALDASNAFQPYVAAIAAESGKTLGKRAVNVGTEDAPAYRWMLYLATKRERRANPVDGAAE